MKQNKKAVTLIGTTLLCLSACSQTPEKNDEIQENSQQEQVSYQQAVEREKAIAKRDVWHAAKLNGVSFRAIGQEPAWLLEFYPNEKITLSRDYGKIIQSFKYPVPSTDKVQRRSVFILKIENDNQGKVIIEGKPCSDIMSGEKFETTVTVVIEGQSLMGCGKSLY